MKTQRFIPANVSNNSTSEMRNLLLLIMTAFALIGCRETFQGQSQKKEDAIAFDTITIDIKGWLQQAVKFKDKFYCFFEEDQPYGGNEITFYVISKDGKIRNVIFVPDEMQQSYLDLHVRNDSILAKSYYDHRTYFFDESDNKWEETKKADDRVFEDDNFYVTFLDFGEFGGTLWFKNKQTSIEYEIASGTPVINKLHGKYYVSTTKKVFEIENPEMLNKAASDSTYEIIEKKKWSMGSKSTKGAKVIYIDSSYYRDPEFYIATSFLMNNDLYFLTVDSNVVYLAEIKNGKAINNETILRNSRVYKMHNSYRQNPNQLPNQLLQFSSTDSRLSGFIEIDKKNIKVHYIKNLETAPLIGKRKAESTFIDRLDFITEEIGNLSLKQIDSLELLLKASDATPRHKISIGKDSYPNKENYIIESPKVYKTIEDSTLTLLTNYWYTKPDMSVKAFTCEWERTFENAYGIYTNNDAPELNDSYQDRFNNIYSHLIKIYGSPTGSRKNSNGQYFSWQQKNNLNIVLYYAKTEQYRNIYMTIYKE